MTYDDYPDACIAEPFYAEIPLPFDSIAEEVAAWPKHEDDPSKLIQPADAPTLEGWPFPPDEPQGPTDTPELKQARRSRTLHLRCGDSVPLTPVGWLWPRWLPHGLSWLEGDPGTNKSMMTLYLGSLVTRGLPFPGETEAAPPASILYLSSGEDPDEVIMSRFIRVGGDPSRIFLLDVQKIMSDTEVKEEVRGLPVLPDDASLIVQTAQDCGSTLILLDAGYSFVSSKQDIFNDHQLRAALEPFARLCAKSGITALALRHLTKVSRGAQHSGLGAVAGGAVARSVLLMNIEDEKAPEYRTLGCSKSSYAAKPKKQFSFKVNADSDIAPAWLSFEGTTDTTIGKSAAASRNPKIKESQILYSNLLKAFTEAFAASPKLPLRGPANALNMESVARSAGYTDSSDFKDTNHARRLKLALQFDAKQERGPKGPIWYWEILPTKSSQ
jgi:hypothetical protein